MGKYFAPIGSIDEIRNATVNIGHVISKLTVDIGGDFGLYGHSDPHENIRKRRNKSTRGNVESVDFFQVHRQNSKEGINEVVEGKVSRHYGPKWQRYEDVEPGNRLFGQLSFCSVFFQEFHLFN